jgi:polysaccharide export outer membrane protein
MTWKGWISTLGLLVFAAIWTGCETDKVVKEYICTSDEIRVGDTLTISLLDIPTEQQLVEKQFSVRSDGFISLPYNLTIKAAGKKFGEFEQEVRKAYIDMKIFSRVTVVVKAGERFYTVDGEVKAPDRKLYIGDTTVVRAIASCGGFTEYANRRKVRILRATGQTEVVDCRKASDDPRHDRRICPGDIIIVPRSL